MTKDRKDPGSILTIVSDLKMERQLADQRGDEARVAQINDELEPLMPQLRAFADGVLGPFRALMDKPEDLKSRSYTRRLSSRLRPRR